MRTFFFYFLTLVVLLSTLFVVSLRNLFRSTIALITFLLGVSGLYLLLDAQFLSAVQITVYVGGIVVLIVYVVLLVADVTQKAYPPRARWRQTVAATLAVGLFALLAAALLSFDFGPDLGPAARSASINEIGKALLSPERGGYALPFEIISLVLIAALVGAITIARASEAEKPAENKR